MLLLHCPHILFGYGVILRQGCHMELMHRIHLRLQPRYLLPVLRLVPLVLCIAKREPKTFNLLMQALLCHVLVNEPPPELGLAAIFQCSLICLRILEAG